ncbi:MAG: serine protease [Bdellovibrio sp. CG12_big_fil_rev_8_21_14_0_65_39_13]|nr:MAG: serine protease [Bdellovibrio sp. CG12_big_fil_rev_8_21_14_0_65_39_13]PIR33586.1 MAG: serine protease [Bdellovibrio sp. CG11_big_fil_rev_8_21_14_0_20_39_38]
MASLKHYSLLFLTGLIAVQIVSCVPSKPKEATSSVSNSQDNNTVTIVPSNQPLISGTPNSSALQGIYYSWRPSIEVTGATLSITNLPSWASFNSNSAEIFGTPKNYGSFDGIIIKAVKGANYTEIGPFSIFVHGDPLMEYSWQLGNTGQTGFAKNGGTAGEDLNLSQTTSEFYTGNQIVVAISDTGLEILHPDLKQNVVAPLSKNYNLASPYLGDPTNSGTEGDHGTSVAGIIGARGWNDIGNRGVAPYARLVGLNYLKSDFSTAISLDQATGPYHIFNYSYGTSFDNTTFEIDSNYNDQILYGFQNGRNGKGQSYVKAAGNSFFECDLNHAGYYRFLTLCASQNANTDPDNVLPWMIVVGANNAKGISSSYSSAGSSLWISAPGGEFGETDPAIITTDVSGCSKGYSYTSSGSTDFNKGTEALNSSCDYTNTFNGTSSAAPHVSGLIALLLEVNPNLTSRDVKHILATTARRIDANRGDSGHPLGMDLSGHTYEMGWTQNAAGYYFHNWYGFGAADVDAAVAMAKTYSTNLGTMKQSNSAFSSGSGNINVAIPDESATGVSRTLTITQNYKIEAVQVKVNITHGRPGDLGIELTSPSGTKSILMNINNALLHARKIASQPVWTADLTNFVMLSNAFYGENSQGTWTIKVIDGLGSNTGKDFDKATNQTGTLVNWSINIIGH